MGLGLLVVYLGVAALALAAAAHMRQRHNDTLSTMLRADKTRALAMQALTDTLVIHHITLRLLLDPDRLDLAPQKTQAFDRILGHYRALRELKVSGKLAGLLDQMEAMHDRELGAVDTRVLETVYENPAEARRLFQEEYEPVLHRYEELVRQTVELSDRQASQAQEDLRVEADHLFATNATALSLLGLCGLCALGVCLGIVQMLSRRLDYAASKLRNVASGDLTTRIQLQKNEITELKTIFETFNEMVILVQQRDERLQSEKTRVETTMVDLERLVDQMRTLGGRLTTATEEIAGQVRNQEASASEQAASSVAVLSSSLQISTISRELVETMNQVARLCENTTRLALQSESSQSQVHSVMESILSASTTITEELATLNERAHGINRVITTIIQIADQTNLLSLNAALEASRAGEAGRGFSVVAQEIGRLASHTASSVLEIERTLQQMQEAVQSALAGVTRFTRHIETGAQSVEGIGRQLTLIGGQVQALAPRFEEVKAGMEQQHLGASQISEAMRQIADLAQRNVASLRDTNQAVSQAQGVAGELRAVVSAGPT
jgi:methyl-accepting chemotaxis protein WspA